MYQNAHDTLRLTLILGVVLIKYVILVPTVSKHDDLSLVCTCSAVVWIPHNKSSVMLTQRSCRYDDFTLSTLQQCNHIYIQHRYTSFSVSFACIDNHGHWHIYSSLIQSMSSLSRFWIRLHNLTCMSCNTFTCKVSVSNWCYLWQMQILMYI